MLLRLVAFFSQNSISSSGPGCVPDLRTCSGSSFSTFLICRVHVTTAVSSTCTRSLSFDARSTEESSTGGSGSSVFPWIWPMVT